MKTHFSLKCEYPSRRIKTSVAKYKENTKFSFHKLQNSSEPIYLNSIDQKQFQNSEFRFNVSDVSLDLIYESISFDSSFVR